MCAFTLYRQVVRCATALSGSQGDAGMYVVLYDQLQLASMSKGCLCGCREGSKGSSLSFGQQLVCGAGADQIKLS